MSLQLLLMYRGLIDGKRFEHSMRLRKCGGWMLNVPPWAK